MPGGVDGSVGTFSKSRAMGEDARVDNPELLIISKWRKMCGFIHHLCAVEAAAGDDRIVPPKQPQPKIFAALARQKVLGVRLGGAVEVIV